MGTASIEDTMTSKEAGDMWDVVIIGAGPSGSACAAYLADRGLKILVLDAQDFPRFQIGESLLPLSLPVLEELGIETTPDIFVFKRGATFVSEAEDKHRHFDFANALDGPPRHAWQVRRDLFDAALLARARRAGAHVEHGVKVRRVELSPSGVDVHTETDSKTFRTRYLIDASGQGRTLARQFDSAVPYEGFGRAAAFVHFDGIPDTFERDIGPGNDIQIMVMSDGWGWVIPLPDKRLSVGLVTRRRGIVGDLEQHLEHSALIKRWTAGAKRSEPKAVRNFSYQNAKAFGPRFACVGDAACFLDPVFSSGVSLGLVGAQRLTRVLGPALEAGVEDEPSLMAESFQQLQPGYDAFAAIIDRFYHTRFAKHFFFGETSDMRLEREVTSVLAGDVWREDNGFQQMLARSRRRRQPALNRGSNLTAGIPATSAATTSSTHD